MHLFTDLDTKLHTLSMVAEKASECLLAFRCVFVKQVVHVQLAAISGVALYA